MDILNLEELIECGYIHIDKSKLPTKGLFYSDDLEIFAKGLTKKELFDFYNIFSYENVNTDRLYKTMVLYSLLKKGLKFTKKFNYKYIKTYDVLYLSLFIINLSIDGGALINPNYDLFKNVIHSISYDKMIENLYDFNLEVSSFDNYQIFYDKKKKSYNIDGYLYCPPSIGLNMSLINILSVNENINPTAIIFSNFQKYNKNSIKENDLLNMSILYESYPDNELKKLFHINSIFTEYGKQLLNSKHSSYILTHELILAILRNHYFMIEKNKLNINI